MLDEALAKLVEDAVARALARARPPMPEPRLKLLLTIPEAAKLVSLSDRTIYRLIDAGELRATTIGSIKRIPTAELERWVMEGVNSDEETGKRARLDLAK